LHGRVVNAVGVGEHGKGVTGEGAIREDVTHLVVKGPQAGSILDEVPPHGNDHPSPRFVGGLDVFFVTEKFDSRSSPYVLSCFVALREKQLPFEVKTIALNLGAQHEPTFARQSLTSRVPVLIDGDLALSSRVRSSGVEGGARARVSQLPDAGDRERLTGPAAELGYPSRYEAVHPRHFALGCGPRVLRQHRHRVVRLGGWRPWG
jgi:hypothetical protein